MLFRQNDPFISIYRYIVCALCIISAAESAFQVWHGVMVTYSAHYAFQTADPSSWYALCSNPQLSVTESAFSAAVYLRGLCDPCYVRVMGQCLVIGRNCDDLNSKMSYLFLGIECYGRMICLLAFTVTQYVFYALYQCMPVLQYVFRSSHILYRGVYVILVTYVLWGGVQ